MSKYIDNVLFQLVSNFAEYHDEEEPYWWGHDTNLGKQSAAFTTAKKAINKYKREMLPTKHKGSAYALIPIPKRKKIAEAMFGKNKVPSWWHGSLGEYELLEKIASLRSLQS